MPITLIPLKCKLCHFFGGLLHNPYQYSGQVIAKMCVNAATIVWSFVVLWKDDALAAWPSPRFIVGALGENFVAGLFLLLASVATLRLLFRSAPLILGSCVYGAFLMLWLYTLSTLIIAISSGITSLRPGQLAGVIVVTALAAFAFVSNPKRTDNEPAAD